MWCGRSSAIISPASTGRSCWSTCSPRSMPARPRWPTWRRRSTDVLAAFRAGRNTSLSRPVRAAHRPRAVRRHQGRPPAPRSTMPGWKRSCAPGGARRARSEAAGAARQSSCGGSVRATREASVREGRADAAAIIGTPRRARSSPARCSTGRAKRRSSGRAAGRCGPRRSFEGAVRRAACATSPLAAPPAARRSAGRAPRAPAPHPPRPRAWNS